MRKLLKWIIGKILSGYSMLMKMEILLMYCVLAIFTTLFTHKYWLLLVFIGVLWLREVFQWIYDKLK